MKRLGTVCKWIDSVDQIASIPKDCDAKRYNTSTTTVAWLNRQTIDVAEGRLWDLMVGNIGATRLLVERIGNLHPELRMLRLSSDIFPCYTEPKWHKFWQRSDVRAYAERELAAVGNLARTADVRLSMHPGQFTVLASDRDSVVDLSIQEMEYHADIARWMGYGTDFQGFKINVHIAGRRGADGIRAVYGRMSPEARNCITIENEENTHGLDDCLALTDIVPIVLDIHHHWIREGQYIQPDDPRISKIVDSWRGVRPVVHYSVSRESGLSDHSTEVLPCRSTLFANGHGKQTLRAHSDFYWNRAANDWALSHWSWADLMLECKSKSLGVKQLWDYANAVNTGNK